MTGAYAPPLEEVRIRRVLEAYCALLDDGDVDKLMELFDDDCSFAMMGRTYQGRASLASVWERLTRTDRPSTLHALFNPQITVQGDRASAVSGWAMIDRSGTNGRTVIAMAGRYHDTLERGGDAQWRFTSRRVQTLARPTEPEQS